MTPTVQPLEISECDRSEYRSTDHDPSIARLPWLMTMLGYERRDTIRCVETPCALTRVMSGSGRWLWSKEFPPRTFSLNLVAFFLLTDSMSRWLPRVALMALMLMSGMLQAGPVRICVFPTFPCGLPALRWWARPVAKARSVEMNDQLLCHVYKMNLQLWCGVVVFPIWN